jgi:hypothetical protein
MRKVTTVKTVRKGMVSYSVRSGVTGKGKVLFVSHGSGNVGTGTAYDQMDKFLQENDHLTVVNRKGFDNQE